MVLPKPIKIILIVLLVIVLLVVFITLLPLILFILFAVVSAVMNIGMSFEPSNENVVELDFNGRIFDVDNEGNMIVLGHENKLVNYNLFTEDKQVTYLINEGVAIVKCYDSEKIIFSTRKLIEGTERDYRELLGIYDQESQKTLLFEPESRQTVYISSNCNKLLNENSQILANGTVLSFCDEYERLCYRDSNDYRFSPYFLDNGERVVFAKESRSETNIIIYSPDDELIVNESFDFYSKMFGSYSKRWDSENNVFIFSSQSRFSESVFIFDPYEKTIEEITFGDTPWKDENSEPGGMACFSCGCSCYQYAYYFIMNDTLHVHISGYGYKRDYQGIYRIDEENNWIKINDLVIDHRSASYSPNSCFISWNKDGDQDNPIQFTNICE